VSRAPYFAVESRWPTWARWRPVTVRPHDERHDFDPATGEIRFHSFRAAFDAAADMARANAGEYRVTVRP
jgi:hypothetical protein